MVRAPGGSPVLLLTATLIVLAAFVGPLTNASNCPLASAPITPSGAPAAPGKFLVDQLPTPGMVPKASVGAPKRPTGIWACEGVTRKNAAAQQSACSKRRWTRDAGMPFRYTNCPFLKGRNW